MQFGVALRRAVAMAPAVIAAVAVGACGSSGDKSSDSATAAKPVAANPALKGNVTIGAVVPLTGSSATIGKDQQRGIALAVDKINSEGGVLGKKLQVKIEDSEGSAPASVQAARKLVSVDHAPVVLGEYSSGNTVPIGKYLQKQNVVHINPGSSSPDISAIGDYSFSVIGLDTLAGKFMAEKLGQAGYKKVAFIAPNNSYGSRLLEVAKTAVPANGGQLVSSVLYTEGQSDYRSELQRLKSANPDVYVYTAYGKEAATINKQAFQLGIDPKQFFGIYLTMCAGDSDKRAVEGQQGMDVNYIGPDGKAYETAYKAKYGEDFKSSFSGYVYDGVMLAAQAMNAAKSTDPAKIKTALAQIQQFKGATGDIAFDKDGQRLAQPYMLGVMAGGKMKQEPAVQGPAA
jgi:branched-chain amino acid transport system substrate-binding protein